MNFLDITGFFVGVLINLLLVALICFYFKRKIDNLEVAQSEQAKMLFSIISNNDSINNQAPNINNNLNTQVSQNNLMDGLDLTQLQNNNEDRDSDSDNNSDEESDDSSIEEEADETDEETSLDNKNTTDDYTTTGNVGSVLESVIDDVVNNAIDDSPVENVGVEGVDNAIDDSPVENVGVEGVDNLSDDSAESINSDSVESVNADSVDSVNDQVVGNDSVQVVDSLVNQLTIEIDEFGLHNNDSDSAVDNDDADDIINDLDVDVDDKFELKNIVYTESSDADTGNDYEKMTVKALKVILSEKGVTVKSSMTKFDIITILKDNESDN
jgi:hypothetical protein